MRSFMTRFFLVLPLTFVFSFSLLAQDRFDRSAELPASELDPGGFGGIVSGVDFDGDGKQEFYAINNGWDIQVGLDMVPRLYKYEWQNGHWEIVWSTETDVTLQNTWPALTYGDWDKDGKYEIIWGPVNNFSFQGTTQPNPARILVFEAKGDGSDEMGVHDPISGNYRPNAQWTIVDGDNENVRPFRWFLHDIDSDATDELVACTRAGSFPYLVISVDDIPDAADSSETWTLEANGDGSEIAGNTYYDMVVSDSSMYLIRSNGDVATVTYKSATDSFEVTKVQTGLVPGGSWKSASLVDIDDNGENEIVVGGWSSSSFNEVWVLQKDADSLSASSIGRPGDLFDGGRIYGGHYGDVDGDGNMDFVFGSRSTVPNGSIYRVEHQGGDITDPGNYEISVIDRGILPVSGRFDVVAVGNLDHDGKDEILYTGIPSNVPPPIVVLEHVPGNQPVIDEVVDVPNDQGRNVWVTWRGAADDVGGRRATAHLNGGNEVGPVATPAHGRATFTLDRDAGKVWYMLEVYNIDSVTAAHIHQGAPGVNGGAGVFLYSGDAGGAVNGVLSRGVITADDLIGPWAGDWEAFMDDVATGNTYVNVHTTTNPGGEIRGQVLADPLESGLAKTSGFTITHYIVWRVAHRVGGSTYISTPPVQVATTQAIQADRYGAVVPTLADGDTTSAKYVVSAHTANVLTLWKSFPKDGWSLDNLAPAAPGNVLAREAEAPSGETVVEVSWDQSQDPDFNYFTLVKSTESGFDPETADVVAQTTETQVTDEDVAVGQNIYYRVATVDLNGNRGKFSDEVSLIVTSVSESAFIPTEYSLGQNYPNPFNPTTTIDFTIKEKGHVTLTVFSTLGREVARLADTEYVPGRYSVTFDATRYSSGVYFYVLRVNGLTLRKKMSLLK